MQPSLTMNSGTLRAINHTWCDDLSSETEVLEGDSRNGGGVLFGSGGGELVEAAFVAASHHVEDGPCGGAEGCR